MSESNAMQEIRRIRDENSLRRLSMSKEGLADEMRASVSWFLGKVGKPVPIVSKDQELRAG